MSAQWERTLLSPIPGTKGFSCLTIMEITLTSFLFLKKILLFTKTTLIIHVELPLGMMVSNIYF